MVQYRCDVCRTTSPPTTRGGLVEARDDHRRRFHGGHIPDGETVIEPQRFQFRDVPREQWIGGAIMFAIFAILIFIRHG